jgi:two-component system LytT family response regulator
MNSIAIFNQGIKKHHLLLLLLSLLLAVVGKDLLHSTSRNTAFYWSDSLLFSVFWLLFIPMVLINWSFLKIKQEVVLTILLSLFHVCFFALFIHVTSSFLFSDPHQFFRVLTDTVGRNGVACLLVYGVFNFKLQQIPKTENTKMVAAELPTKIKVKHRNNTIVLDIDKIIYIQSERPYIALVTQEKKYLYRSTLKEFLSKNNCGNFIQIHKSIIINTKYISAFKSRKNGDFDIELDKQHILKASRNFAENFKSYLK